jgi:hypothetical protein
MLLGVSALDDRAFALVFPVGGGPGGAVVGWYDWLIVALTLALLVLSYRPARNLISSGQLMNASFEPLHLVNTYGAFGSVTRVRDEVVIEGTTDDPESPNAAWREYEFRGKPTDVRRRPPQWAPYHLRLDWLMWFAALSPSYAYPWLQVLVIKLLRKEPATLRLLRNNPFSDQSPRAIRAVLYRYRFTTRQERRETGAWWVRTRLGEYLPPIMLLASTLALAEAAAEGAPGGE